MSGRDWLALGGAALLHGALALALARAPSMVRKPPQVVEVVVHRVEPPPPPPPIAPPPEPKPPPPEPPPPPPRVHPVKAPPPPVAQAPIPNKATPPPEPPKAPPKPVFGVNMDSVTEGDTAFAVPVGNTTIADPKTARPGEPVAPLAPAPPQAVPGPPVYRPASDTWLASDPTVDAASCTTVYPDGEARELGIEGTSALRVNIDETGKVRGVKLLKGVGHGLDEEAMRMLRTRCRFGPAYDKHHQPVSTAITYIVTWTLD